MNSEDPDQPVQIDLGPHGLHNNPRSFKETSDKMWMLESFVTDTQTDNYLHM